MATGTIKKLTMLKSNLQVGDIITWEGPLAGARYLVNQTYLVLGMREMRAAWKGGDKRLLVSIYVVEENIKGAITLNFSPTDMILRQGAKVFPEEIEYYTHKSIKWPK